MTNKRPSKRITWKPENDVSTNTAEPAADTFTTSSDGEGAGSRPQSNDDRLRADKPPHWG